MPGAGIEITHNEELAPLERVLALRERAPLGRSAETLIDTADVGLL